jgi:hypothetical protein
VIKDALKEELKEEILGSAKYAQAWSIFKRYFKSYLIIPGIVSGYFFAYKPKFLADIIFFISI